MIPPARANEFVRRKCAFSFETISNKQVLFTRFFLTIIDAYIAMQNKLNFDSQTYIPF